MQHDGPMANALGATREVVPYVPDADGDGVYALWQRIFGERWPITRDIFREVTEAVYSGVQTNQLVAKDSTGRVLGYLGSQLRARKETEASIVLLMVEPDRRRAGVGTKLLRAAMEAFRDQGITTIHLGAHAELPFWHGVPMSLLPAKRFFEKHGWQFYEESYDLIQDLKGFEIPAWVNQRLNQHGVMVRMANAMDVADLFAFLKSEFPGWYRWYSMKVAKGLISDIVIARSASELVGCVIMNDVSCPDWTGRQWRTFLGEDMGALGAVGVKATERGKGIGLAMVAEASRILRDRGVRNCFVHWTWLVDWYGKLGYRVYQEYWMGMRPTIPEGENGSPFPRG
jgi:ribosomal protein S18 acetylase RimI-like enzyme